MVLEDCLLDEGVVRKVSLVVNVLVVRMLVSASASDALVEVDARFNRCNRNGLRVGASSRVALMA